MAGYITFDEYVELGGTLESDAFILAEFKARKWLDYLTDGRISGMAIVPEAVKLCMMTLIKFDSKFSVEQQVDNPVVSSFSNDGYSESYGNGLNSSLSDAWRSVSTEVKRMLSGELDDKGVPLCYRGLDL